jgi:hypothetical protein
MNNLFSLQKIKRTPMFLLIAVLLLIISGLIFYNWNTESQKELSVRLRKELENGLDKNVEQVQCYREIYGHKNEFVRHDCNYIGKNYKNMGVAFIEENELTSPFLVASTYHELDAVAFVRNRSANQAELTFQYNIFSATNPDKLSQADAYYQKKLVQAIIHSRN